MSDPNNTPDPAAELDALKKQLEEATAGIAALKAKNDELLGETKAERQKRRDIEEAAKREAEEAARKAGDVGALEKSWQDKLAKREAELAGEVKARDAMLHDLTVNATATRMAAELAVPGSAKALEPHIKARLSMEQQDGKLVVRVLGLDGKPSALTPEELAKEIASDPAFAPLIVASKASGGGAAGAGKSGGAAKSITRSQFEAMSPNERMAHAKNGGLVTD